MKGVADAGRRGYRVLTPVRTKSEAHNVALDFHVYSAQDPDRLFQCIPARECQRVPGDVVDPERCVVVDVQLFGPNVRMPAENLHRPCTAQAVLKIAAPSCQCTEAVFPESRIEFRIHAIDEEPFVEEANCI